MTDLVELKRPIRRRHGSLVVTMAPEGLTIRGYGCQKSVTYSWEETPGRTPQKPPPRTQEYKTTQLANSEAVDGLQRLQAMKADPNTTPKRIATDDDGKHSADG